MHWNQEEAVEKDGATKFRDKGVSVGERKMSRAQSEQTSEKAQALNLRSDLEADNIEPMALSNEVKNCLIKNGLEGFIRVAEAPPHEELDKLAMTIVVDKLSEGMVQAAIELPSRGLYLIENPSTQILMRYFGEFSIASKA